MSEQQVADRVRSEAESLARLLADESFRHSWDMSEEQKINGAWVAGLCCECGEFVPFGEEVDHISAAFASLLTTPAQPEERQ